MQLAWRLSRSPRQTACTAPAPRRPPPARPRARRCPGRRVAARLPEAMLTNRNLNPNPNPHQSGCPAT
eukprot:scaffold62399_cov60-Phaeocystis_antarctica.AAC.1